MPVLNVKKSATKLSKFHYLFFLLSYQAANQEGRESMLGHQLNCKKCDLGEPKDSLWFLNYLKHI